jgi:hypothetical protein
MLHCIAHIFEPLLRLVWPGPGRHRGTGHPSTGLSTDAMATHSPRTPLRPLRGEEIGLVRPYLVAHERREAQRRRARRRALWLAVHGIDIGPRLIHGVEVTA